ncbi:hypothetical protein N7468_004664 [Penicillium chermesinum]|uniref:Uncharacterized protein n=1 Tax=Penicillium chermesinum TaxID=63820 RepID=A0A9W9P975_9EURO|nr:uncharacterized protein N7468_004664 [Penicillium chermesinum]KAJ5240045.1 hypothetical protein N7468_004664 [Penicillium chermesinum]KAJ6166922.1 hypothetical protein N7470_002369 [Penicillium chermesinum]
MPQFSPSDGLSKDASTESETRQGTETPASSLDFDMANIDPRLMEPSPITVVEPSTCPLSIEIAASSDGHPATSTDSNMPEISTRRVTRGAAKAANLEPGPQLGSSPKHAMPPSRKRGCSEEQPIRKRRGKRRPDESKASNIQLTPRRSMRLRAR